MEQAEKENRGAQPGQDGAREVENRENAEKSGPAHGSKKSAFNESSAQDHQRSDRNPLKETDDDGMRSA